MPCAEVRAGRLVGLRGGCDQQLPHHASAASRRRPVGWGALRTLTGWKHWAFSRSQLTAPLVPQLGLRHASITAALAANNGDTTTTARILLAAWLPARPMCSERGWHGQDSQEGR